MQSARIAKTSPSVSSTCTIGGGGDPLDLWKTPKNKQVIDRLLIAISSI